MKGKRVMKNKGSGNGISFSAALTLLLIGLKLGGVINWSWIWVLFPLWFDFALILFIAILISTYR